MTGFKLLDHLDPKIILKLLLKAQREEEAALIQLALAEKAIINQDVDTAINFVGHLVERRHRHPESSATDNQLVSTVLKVSELCFANGKSFSEILPLLQKTRSISDDLGDRRSQALIDMHTGLVFYLFGMDAESLKAFSAGKETAEALGDDDILKQTANYTGLSYFIRGDYKKAVPYFEKAVAQTPLIKDDFIDSFVSVFFSLAAMGLSQFDRALAIMDIFYQKAAQKNQVGAATILRAALGYILLRHHKKQEATAHLAIALREAGEQGNVLALYWTNLFMAYHQFLIGNLTEARNIFMKAQKDAAGVRLGTPYSVFPWILDALLEFERQNMAQIPDCDLDIAAGFIMNGQNVPLKGYLMRILAKRLAIKKGPVDQIQSYLENSMKCFEHTGLNLELSKTRIEMVRLELFKGNRDKAQEYAREAWRNLPPRMEHLFPNVFQHLIENVSKGPFLKSLVMFKRWVKLFQQVFWRMADRCLSGVTRNRARPCY